MTIADEIEKSRKLVQFHWPHIAAWCPDRALNGSRLHPVEGMTGHRAQDLDRRSHIDHFAVVRTRWTPLSTRVQDSQFAHHRTITLRRTEVEHLRRMHFDDLIDGADLHVHLYADDAHLSYVVIARLAPIALYLAETPMNAHYWLEAPDGTPFIAMGRGVRNGHGTLRALEALVWCDDPTSPHQGTLL